MHTEQTTRYNPILYILLYTIVEFENVWASTIEIIKVLFSVNSHGSYCFIYFFHSQPQLATFRDAIPIHRKF